MYNKLIASASIFIAIFINFLANAVPINGQNTGQISDAFKVFFVPAGYVFSIWGLIYILLITFAIYQLLPQSKDNKDLDSIAIPVIISSIANSVWIFLWHYNQIYLTVGVMLVLLASLIYIYLKLGIGMKKVSREMKYFVHLTFSVYLGWITVATIANITDALWSIGWNGFGISGEVWAAILIVIAGVIASIMLYRKSDIAYGLVIVWALVGIAVKFSSVNEIVWSVVLSVVVILGSTGFILYKKNN
jgi:hypothetical protein